MSSWGNGRCYGLCSRRIWIYFIYLLFRYNVAHMCHKMVKLYLEILGIILVTFRLFPRVGKTLWSDVKSYGRLEVRNKYFLIGLSKKYSRWNINMFILWLNWLYSVWLRYPVSHKILIKIQLIAYSIHECILWYDMISVINISFLNFRDLFIRRPCHMQK